LLRAEVEGSIKLRSFIAGSPELRLGLNEDLVVRGNDTNVSYARVQLDDAIFHPCVSLVEWETDRSLIFTPPDGEFTLMQVCCKIAYVTDCERA